MPYPPDKNECISIFNELKKLDIESVSGFVPRKYEIIHDLAEAHFYEARKYIVSGLDNPDPDYRWACISALATHWSDKNVDFENKLMGMSEHDPDVDVRVLAISSLGFLKIEKARPLLEKISKSNKEDRHVIETAKKALSDL